MSITHSELISFQPATKDTEGSILIRSGINPRESGMQGLYDGGEIFLNVKAAVCH